MSREKLCVLGATGSIGDSTLALLALHPERFAVHALSAHRNIHKLFERALQFCLLYTSPSPRDQRGSRMPSSA